MFLAESRKQGKSAMPASPKKTMDIREKAVKAALALAARDGWGRVTLQAVARHAKISLAQLHEHFEDRGDILAAYERMIDRRVLENTGEIGEDANPRESLFDIIMERFDALNEDREALIAILDHVKCDPRQMAISMPHLARSMSWMLEAAHIDTTGLRGAAHIIGLTSVYLVTLKTWREDESPDMSKTMAALDRNLGRAEQLGNTLGLIG